MKNLNANYLLFFSALILLLTTGCNKIDECIVSFEPVCQEIYSYDASFFKGTYLEDSLCLGENNPNTFFYITSYIAGRSKPGEPFPKPEQLVGHGAVFVMHYVVDDKSFEIDIKTPVYPLDSSFETIIDDVKLYLNKESIPMRYTNHSDISTSDSSYYRIDATYDCHANDYSYTEVKSVSFAINDAKNDPRFDKDQYGRWIKVLEFEKKDLGDKIYYSILFDINVNLYVPYNTLGRLKGKFRVNGTIPK